MARYGGVWFSLVFVMKDTASDLTSWKKPRGLWGDGGNVIFLIIFGLWQQSGFTGGGRGQG